MRQGAGILWGYMVWQLGKIMFPDWKNICEQTRSELASQSFSILCLGLCKEYEKGFEQQNLQELKEKQAVNLQKSHAMYSKQQPPQPMQEEPVEPFHQEVGPYVSEATPQIQSQNNWQVSEPLPQQQPNHSANFQGQQLQKHEQQASQQWQLADETLHYQEQQPGVSLHHQEQQPGVSLHHQEQQPGVSLHHQEQQQQQQQEQQQRYQSLNFNPSTDPYRYQSINSFPQATEQAPSQPQPIQRTSSLPHLPTQILGHQANTNQQTQTQSKFVVSIETLTF